MENDNINIQMRKTTMRTKQTPIRMKRTPVQKKIQCRRHGNKWSIPEVLQLQREYELLDLPIETICDLHSRSENSILFRIELEGFETHCN